MKPSVEKITPDVAKKWLEKNLPTNRTLRQRHICCLAADMADGRWLDDGAPYRFDEDGNLLDGQHRLMAIIKSGTTQTGLVVRGLKKDAFTTMDTGAKRGTADALHIGGEANSKVLAGALTVVADYMADGTIYGGQGRQGRTTQELVDMLDTCPKVRESVRIALMNAAASKSRSGSSIQLLPPSLAAGLHTLFDDKDGALADDFVRGLAMGFDAGKRPVFALLRERLMGNRMSKAKLPRTVIAQLCVKAWNAERSNTKPKQLRHVDGEPFPEIK